MKSAQNTTGRTSAANTKTAEKVRYSKVGSPVRGFTTEYKATRLLTPTEERDLVAELAVVRDKVTELVEPLLADAPDGLRLNHFDQKLSHYAEIQDSLPKRTVGRIERQLDKYREIKDELVLANLPWVTKLARSQRQSVITEEDLFQEGICGLLKAIDRFEPQRGLRLMTYATWYIREAMQQIRARQSHLVGLSSHDQTLLGQLENHKTEFVHENQRLPTARELSKKVKKNAQSLRRLQQATAPSVSLERTRVEGGLSIPVPDPVHDVDARDERTNKLSQLLDTLPHRERLIVTRRFGLEGREPESLEDLGTELHVSKERVRQLQRQAIKRMQQFADDSQMELLSL